MTSGLQREDRPAVKPIELWIPDEARIFKAVEVEDRVPLGIAVQDGNIAEVNPATGKRVEVPELVKFATEYLNVDYIFWGTEEPY